MRMVFGDKYPDPCRVVCIGVPIEELEKDPDNEKWDEYSLELCGGTHIKNTRDAEIFTILSEAASGSGKRRIFAVTGDAANEANNLADQYEEELKELEELSKTNLGLLKERLASFQDRLSHHATRIPAWRSSKLDEKVKVLIKKTISTNKADAKAALMSMEEKAEECKVQGKTYFVGEVQMTSKKPIKPLTDCCKKFLERDIPVLLIHCDQNKKKKAVTLMADVSEELVKKGLKANEWVKYVATILKGNGGGKPTHAQGVAHDKEGIAQALEKAEEFVKKILG